MSSSRAERETGHAYLGILRYSLRLAIGGCRRDAWRCRRPRPGTGEGIFLLLRMSKPVGPFQVHDWLMRKHGPLLDAQPKVWAIGTQSAIDAADRVLLAAAGVLQAAATINMDSVADRGADHRRIVGGARRSLNNGATYRERLFNLMTECSA